MTTANNKSVNRRWLAFRFFNAITFVYNSWCANVESVGPPTRLPQSFAASGNALNPTLA